MELTATEATTLHAAATGLLSAQNERLREIINNALVELMNYENRPTTFAIRDAVKELLRA